MTVNRKKRSLAALALSATAIFALSACSSGTTPAETTAPETGATEAPVTNAAGALTVWVDQERVAALQGVVDAYTAASGIEVNLVGRNFDDLKNDFIQQVPTGEGPDVVMGAHDWVGELTSNGVVAPLELGDAASKFAKVAIDASTYEGTTYMLPYAVENIAVLRNADLVAEAATSFDDMIEKGKAAGLDQPFVVETGADGNPYHYYPFQTAFGAPVFGSDENGYNASDLQLGSAGGELFAAWLSANGKNGAKVFNTDIDGDIAKQSFLDGKSAFWLTGPWNVGAATEGGINVAIDLVPSPTDQAASPFAGVKGFFVSAESQNKLAANDFLVNYLGSTDAQVELFKAGNVLPALLDAQTVAGADPIIAGFAKVGEQAVPMPAIPEMGAVWQYWGVAEAAIINGDDPATTWQKLATDVAAAIAAG